VENVPEPLEVAFGCASDRANVRNVSIHERRSQTRFTTALERFATTS